MAEAVDLRELREASGLTLVELAARAGVARQTLHRMEKGGAVKAATAAKVARVLSQEWTASTSASTIPETSRREHESLNLSALTEGLLRLSELPLTTVTKLDESDLNRLTSAAQKASARILDARRKIQRAKELADQAEALQLGQGT